VMGYLSKIITELLIISPDSIIWSYEQVVVGWFSDTSKPACHDKVSY
jgi:hypothetical protein